MPTGSVVTRTGPLDNSALGLNGTAPDLIKTGGGELILDGINEVWWDPARAVYTGATRINEGTLTVMNSLAIPDASEVWVDADATFDVRAGHEKIGALTGDGRVSVAWTLKVLGAGSGPFGGRIENVGVYGNGSSTEFRNGAAVVNAAITNHAAYSDVWFNDSRADRTCIANQGDYTYARFEWGAASRDGTVSNQGSNSAALFIDATSEADVITNSGRNSWVLFTHSSSVNGTFIANEGETSYASFASWSTAEGVSILNRGEWTRVDFDSWSTASGGSTIRNEGLGSVARFSYSSLGDVTVTNAPGAGGTIRFDGTSTGTSETTIENGVGGVVDLRFLTVPNLTVGRLFGDGDVALGSHTLRIGSQNRPVDTIGGRISGDDFAALIKDGTGTVVLTGASSVGGCYVEEGTLELDGTLEAADFVVRSGGTLRGSGVVQGDLLNDGTVAPGNSPGTLTITGEYRQAYGTFQLEIGSCAEFDRLLVGDRAVLGGTLEVVPSASLKVATYGQRFDFLHAAGGIEGQFRRIVIPDTGRFRGRFVKADANTGSLVFAPASYTLVARSPNDIALANALDQWIGVETGDIGLATQALDFLAEEQYPAAFAAIEPGAYATALDLQVTSSHVQGRMLNQQLGSRRLAPSQDRRESDFWVQGSGMFSSGGLGLQPSVEFDTGNLLVGGSVDIAPGLAVGLYGGFGEGGVSSDPNLSLDFERASYGGYFTCDAGRWFAHAAVGGGTMDFDAERSIRFANLSRRATSKPETNEFLGLLTVGYQWPAGSRGWCLEPQASIQYTRAELAEVTEAGAGAFNLRLDEAEVESLRTYLGGRLFRQIGLNSGAVLSPYVQAFWLHDGSGRSDSLRAKLDGGGGLAFPFSVSDLDRDSVYASAGLSFWNSGGLSLSVDYNLNWSDCDAPDQGITVGFSQRL